MHRSLNLINEALNIGQMELVRLQEKQIDEAEQCATARFRLLDEACQLYFEECLPEFKEKLSLMIELQKKISAEANKLKTYLQQNLKQIRQESKRQQKYNSIENFTAKTALFFNKQS